MHFLISTGVTNAKREKKYIFIQISKFDNFYNPLRTRYLKLKFQNKCFFATTTDYCKLLKVYIKISFKNELKFTPICTKCINECIKINNLNFNFV